MAYLIDTNILVRLANAADPRHTVAAHAVLELHRRGEKLHITPQVLIEFRNVATPPANGKWPGAIDDGRRDGGGDSRGDLPLLAETPAIYPAWKALVEALGVVGKQIHDARLVAVCHANAVSHLLTFNAIHFARFAGFGFGVVVVDPASV